MKNLLWLLLYVLVAVAVILGIWWALGLLPIGPNMRLLAMAIMVVVILIYGIATFKSGGGGPL